jgi:outer membrane protein
VFLVLLFSVSPVLPRAENLMELYVRGLEFDPDFQRARIERDASLEGLKESRGGLLPGISGSADRTKVYQNVVDSDQTFLFPVGRSDYYNIAYSISLIQPIYRRDALARVPQAKAEVRKAEAEYSAAEQDLIFRVAQAVFSYLAGLENLDFASAERQAIQVQLLEAEERLQSGLVTIADVQDLRGRAALAEASEIGARGEAEDARQGIGQITGKTPEDVGLLSYSFPILGPDDEDVESWVRAALFQNPAIQALEAATEAAGEEVRRQRGAYLPAFDLVASYTHTDSGGTVFGGGNEIRNGEVGIRLAIPVYDSGRTSSRVQVAALRRSATQQEVERERRRVEREVRAAFNNTVAGRTQVEALEKSVFAHEAALGVKEQGWRSGINTGLIVLDARKELFSAKRDLAHARYLYILSSLKLKQAAGILDTTDLRQIDAYLQ